jgi:hypothetical protein
MAPIISVDINTRSLSARWDVKNKQLHAAVRTGLEQDGYVVLTIDDNVSLAAQVRGRLYMHLPCHHCALLHPGTGLCTLAMLCSSVCVRVHSNQTHSVHLTLFTVIPVHIEHMLTRCIGCIKCIGFIVQGAQCNFANLVDGRPSAGGSANPAFVKRLEHKTLLEHRPGECSFLAEVRTLDLSEHFRGSTGLVCQL